MNMGVRVDDESLDSVTSETYIVTRNLIEYVVSPASSCIRWETNLTIRVPVVHHSISGPGIVKAALFRSQSDYGEIVQLSFAQRIENDATCTNICVAHLVPPPWRTTELFVSNLSGSDRKRYTIITCTSAVDTNTQALHNFDALSTWKGDVLVVGHSMGQIGQLISVGDAEIDSLIAALGGIWNR